MNETSAQRFYEKMYAEGRVWAGPQGFLGKLFHLLQRFELHRVPAAVSMLNFGGKILDIGCGDGGLLSLSKAKRQFADYYGVDLATGVVARAKKGVLERTGNIKNCSFKQANLDEKLPFKNSFFDAITCIAVMEHIFDPYFGIKEINRILKKNGILILEVPNLVWLPRRINVLFGILPITAEEDGWDGGHLHYFTQTATKRFVEENGFEIEYIGCTGIFPKILNIWPTLFGGNIMIKAKKKNDVK